MMMMMIITHHRGHMMRLVYHRTGAASSLPIDRVGVQPLTPRSTITLKMLSCMWFAGATSSPTLSFAEELATPVL